MEIFKAELPPTVIIRQQIKGGDMKAGKMIILWVAFLSLLVQRTSSLAIPNGVRGVELICGDSEMELSIETEAPLTLPARIFIKGRSEDPRCGLNYAASGVSMRLIFRVPLGACGMEREGRQGSLDGVVQSIAALVSFHPFFVTKVWK